MRHSLRPWLGNFVIILSRARSNRLSSLYYGLAIILLAGAAYAHDPITTKLTWSREISRIVYKRCTACHREGASAMAFLTYEDVRPWAKAIRDEVLNRRMPPWGAIKGFGEFRDDPSLTQDEIDRIAEWVEGGAPEGDPLLLPTLPALQQPAAPVTGTWMRTALLPEDVAVLAIRPLADAAEAHITALRPDGTVEPMLWLHGYKQEWRRSFVYRNPLHLEKGTRLVSEPELPFEILVKALQPAH